MLNDVLRVEQVAPVDHIDDCDNRGVLGEAIVVVDLECSLVALVHVQPESRMASLLALLLEMIEGPSKNSIPLEVLMNDEAADPGVCPPG